MLRSLGIAVGLLLLTGALWADPPSVAVPPVILPADGIGGGKPVSRPLQPVEVVEVPPVVEASKPDGAEVTVPTEAEMRKTEVRRPLGATWSNYEYLLFWPKGQPAPPLVTLNRGTTPPVLGGANTLVLVGGSPIDGPNISGGRFTWGWAVNDAQTAGLQGTYVFLGSRTTSIHIDADGAGGRFVGRPLFNPVTGRQDYVPVSGPGGQTGTIDVSATTRITGWEISGVANLASGENGHINAIAGYRYLAVYEGLRIEQAAYFPQTPTTSAVLASTADQFDAHNRFHGAELGLSADFVQGPIFIEATGKVALGQTVMVVQASGQSVAISPGFPFPAGRWFNGGVLGQPTNTGRFARSAFAVLPEASVKVGYRFRDRSRFYVGYNFLYLSQVVRPGDQIDPSVDPSVIPLFPKSNPGNATNERPIPVLARSDFWAQGLTFGVEYRY